MFAPYVIGFISVCIDAKQDKRLCVECALASAYACISGDWAAILRNMNEHWPWEVEVCVEFRDAVNGDGGIYKMHMWANSHISKNRFIQEPVSRLSLTCVQIKFCGHNLLIQDLFSVNAEITK